MTPGLVQNGRCQFVCLPSCTDLDRILHGSEWSIASTWIEYCTNVDGILYENE